MTLLTGATTEEINSELFARGIAQTLQTAQAILDASEKVKAAGVTVVADVQDMEWVGINFPDDPVGEIQFWASQAAQIMGLGGNEHPTASLRCALRKAEIHLAAIEAVLP